MSFPAYATTGITVPLWMGLAYFDFLVKFGFALLALIPYGALMGWLALGRRPGRQHRARAPAIRS